MQCRICGQDNTPETSFCGNCGAALATTTEVIQPKTLSAIISETFRVYGRGFLKFIAIVTIVEAILYVLGWLWAMEIIVPPSGVVPSAALIVGAVVVAVLSVIVYLWMQGALIHLASALNLRVKSEISGAMRTALKRLAAMIGATLVLCLVVVGVSLVVFFLLLIPFLGIIAAIVLVPVGMYFMVRWAFILQAVLVEGSGPVLALSRSSDLVKDNWWRTFGILFVIGVIAGVISFVLTLVLFFVPVVGPIIAAIISTPIAVIGYTLLYYDPITAN